MNIKLTVKLNQIVIEKAKEYAKTNKTSFLSIIENYLQQITGKEEEKEKITPLVKSLSGIVNLPKDLDYKNAYSNFISDKYK